MTMYRMAWSHPRNTLGLIAIAAWCNVPVEKLPPEHRYHTCAATKEAWDRVASAIAEHLQSRDRRYMGQTIAECDCPHPEDCTLAETCLARYKEEFR